MKLKKGASFYRNCGGVVAGGYYKFFLVYYEIAHLKEFWTWTLRQLFRSDEGLTLETSA